MALSARQHLIKEIQLRLGAGIVNLEPDPEHYDLAVTMALDRYRQVSSNAMEESFIFLDLQPNVDVYTLPNEVQLVRTVYRRGTAPGGGGTSVDPFSLAFTNNIYMLQGNGGGMGTGGTGMLATYDLAMQFQKTAGMMFGREVTFNFNHVTHRLHLHRKFAGVETVLLWAYNMRPEEQIIQDIYAKPWIRDYSVAVAKLIIGEARAKFSQIAGPQGGATLNGEQMKNEGKEEMTRLDEELSKQKDGNAGYGFIIG